MSDNQLYVLEQPASRSSSILSFAVFLPAACSIFVPIGLAATDAAAVVHAVQEQPGAALQVAIGLALWILLFVIPVARRLRQFGLARSVIVDRDGVEEITRTVFGTHRIMLPLNAFAGVVHRIRTSVGGMAHELALVERATGREIVFLAAPRLSRETIEKAMRELGLPEIAASDLLGSSNMGDIIRIQRAEPARPLAA